MITTAIDPVTGLPIISESREKARWRALPRHLSKLATEQDDADDQPWYPQHHLYDGHVLQRVLCWKCGREVKAWRRMLDRDGYPIEMLLRDGLGVGVGMALLPLPHLTATPMAYRLPLLNQTVALNVQHCKDCEIRTEDALQAMACQWAGTDAILTHAWNHEMAAHVTPSRWATYLYRFSTVEPIGRMTPEQVAKAELIPAVGGLAVQKIPAPGELITAAQYIMDLDLATRRPR